MWNYVELRVNIKDPNRKMKLSNVQVFTIYILLSKLMPIGRGYVQLFPHYHSNFEVRYRTDLRYVPTMHLILNSDKKIFFAAIGEIFNNSKATTISKNLHMAHNRYNLQKPSINWRILPKNETYSNQMFTKICDGSI